jgi:hypothetical protein
MIETGSGFATDDPGRTSGTRKNTAVGNFALEGWGLIRVTKTDVQAQAESAPPELPGTRRA